MAENTEWTCEADVLKDLQIMSSQKVWCDGKRQSEKMAEKSPHTVVQNFTSLYINRNKEPQMYQELYDSLDDDSSGDESFIPRKKHDSPKTPMGRAQLLAPYLPKHDDSLQKQLREACGPGYSNELIEYHHKIRVMEYEQKNKVKKDPECYTLDSDDDEDTTSSSLSMVLESSDRTSGSLAQTPESFIQTPEKPGSNQLTIGSTIMTPGCTLRTPESFLLTPNSCSRISKPSLKTPESYMKTCGNSLEISEKNSKSSASITYSETAPEFDRPAGDTPESSSDTPEPNSKSSKTTLVSSNSASSTESASDLKKIRKVFARSKGRGYRVKVPTDYPQYYTKPFKLSVEGFPKL